MATAKRRRKKSHSQLGALVTLTALSAVAIFGIAWWGKRTAFSIFVTTASPRSKKYRQLWFPGRPKSLLPMFRPGKKPRLIAKSAWTIHLRPLLRSLLHRPETSQGRRRRQARPRRHPVPLRPPSHPRHEKPNRRPSRTRGCRSLRTRLGSKPRSCCKISSNPSWHRAKLPEQKSALAEKIIKQADGTQDDPTSKYAMLQESLRLGIELADIAVIEKAIDRLASNYVVNASQTLIDSLEKLAQRPRLPPLSKNLAEVALEPILETFAALKATMAN